MPGDDVDIGGVHGLRLRGYERLWLEGVLRHFGDLPGWPRRPVARALLRGALAPVRHGALRELRVVRRRHRLRLHLGLLLLLVLSFEGGLLVTEPAEDIEVQDRPELRRQHGAVLLLPDAARPPSLEEPQAIRDVGGGQHIRKDHLGNGSLYGPLLLPGPEGPEQGGRQSDDDGSLEAEVLATREGEVHGDHRDGHATHSDGHANRHPRRAVLHADVAH
mmetsp:Transcript_71870/g.208152  ORF Transcript_71870/g.208152 Transcript_71870/m.208152 type:complete len:219 (-) Transcript_71870:928-1584(-)